MAHMRYSLNSLKGVIQGRIMEVMKGDTRSLDSIAHIGIIAPYLYRCSRAGA